MRIKIRRSWLLLLILLFISILSGCDIDDGDIEEKISAPKIVKSPIEGKWKVTTKLKVKASKDSIDEKDVNIGSEGLFRNEALIIGTEYSTNPSFRLKNVVIEDYLLYKYNKDYRDLGLENKNVEVITILNDNQYFLDMIKLNDDEALVYKDDCFYKMEKTASEVSLEEIKRYIEIEQSMVQTLENVENEKLKTGVLLGIKIPKYDEENQISNWTYKTLWINTKDRKIEESYEVEDLLVPRKNGFWKLKVTRDSSSGLVSDKVTGQALIGSKNQDDHFEEEIAVDKNDVDILKGNSTLKNLLFIGSDYISVEKIETDKNDRRTLEIYGIDTLEDNRPIKLSDIIGEEGKDIFIEGAESVIDINDASRVNERNIGLFRKDGYWIFKGRVNYIEKEKELFKDFNIKAIPSEELVNYDKLTIPWNKLEGEIPNLLDAYSSPNNEFVIAKTERKLLLYGLENGNLMDKNPIKIVDLPKNSTVVMTEWATGRYTGLWENEVIRNDGKILE